MYSLVLHLVLLFQVALAVTSYLPVILDGDDIILVRQVRSATPCEGGYRCGPPSFGGPSSFGGPQFGPNRRHAGPGFNPFSGGSQFLPRPEFGPGFGNGGNANANAVANANSKGRGGSVAQADATASANSGGQSRFGPQNFGPQPQFGYPPAALIQGGGGSSVANANANANSRGGGGANAQASATSNSFGGQSSATANANASSNKKCFLCHLGR